MKILSFKLLAVLLAAGFIFSSCTDDGDDPVPQVDSPPSITLAAEVGFLAADGEVAPDSVFNVKINAVQGTALLRSVAIRENGTLVAADRLTVNGAPAGGNPKPVGSGETSTLEWEIGIAGPSEVDQTFTYEIQVSDENNNTQSVSLSVTTRANVTELRGRLLLNSDGPAGQGGLNLLTGEGTGTVSSDPTSSTAHIKDEGIDLNRPNATNWLRQISGINGSELKTPAAGVVFNDVQTKNQIVEAWNDADATAITVSDPVEVDDIFLVNQNDLYFLIIVTAVNNTETDNADSIEFRIKY
ncbi:MAG: hypothetical protein AAF824_16255 [Bacteroidota bacterium]